MSACVLDMILRLHALPKEVLRDLADNAFDGNPDQAPWELAAAASDTVLRKNIDKHREGCRIPQSVPPKQFFDIYDKYGKDAACAIQIIKGCMWRVVDITDVNHFMLLCAKHTKYCPLKEDLTGADLADVIECRPQSVTRILRPNTKDAVKYTFELMGCDPESVIGLSDVFRFIVVWSRLTFEAKYRGLCLDQIQDQKILIEPEEDITHRIVLDVPSDDLPALQRAVRELKTAILRVEGVGTWQPLEMCDGKVPVKDVDNIPAYNFYEIFGAVCGLFSPLIFGYEPY